MDYPLPPDAAPRSRRAWLATFSALGGALALAPRLLAQEAKKGRAKIQVETPPPTKPPLQPVELTRLPDGQTRLDLFLLLGQSNMKGRGLMPAESMRDPRIVMMHLGDNVHFDTPAQNEIGRRFAEKYHAIIGSLK